MPTLKLDPRTVKAIKAPERGRTDYWDTEVRGLSLRVSEQGTKTWMLRYRQGGLHRRFKIGRYPEITLADARDSAREALRSVSKGGDPAADRKQERLAETVSELADFYIKRHAKVHKKSWKDDQRILNNNVLPVLGHHKAKHLKRREVIDLIEGIKERGAPIMANRTLEVMRKMFNFAIPHEIVDINPCRGIAKPGRENQRQRVLSDAEIRAVWEATEEEAKENPLGAAIFKMRLMTAQRGGEIASMRWQDLDLDGGWWTIPPEHSKNGKSHRVPLSQSAKALLEDLQASGKSKIWVFPQRGNSGPTSNLWRIGENIRQRSEVQDFVPHDLRRTVASHMTGMGINRLTVSKLLNHADRQITSVYDRHSYDAEKSEAVKRWDERLSEIIAGRPAKVVALPAESARVVG